MISVLLVISDILKSILVKDWRMEKYRIKLKQGEIIGPLNKDQVIDLYSRGIIFGNELGQVFPSGDWKELFIFEDIKNAILIHIQDNNLPDAVSENFSVTDNVSLNSIGSSSSIDTNIISEHLDSKKSSLSAPTPQTIVPKKPTLLKKIKNKSQFAKTKIVNMAKYKFKEEVKEGDVDVDIPEKANLSLDKSRKFDEGEENSESNKLPLVISSREETKLVEVNKYLPAILNEAEETEEEIRKILEDQEKIKQEQLAKRVKVKKRIRRMTPLLALLFVAAFYLLLSPDEVPKSKFEPIYYNFTFPVASEVRDAEKAKAFLENGKALYYQRSDYPSKIKAAEYFRMATEYDMTDNESWVLLLMTYADLLPHSDPRKYYDNGLIMHLLIQSKSFLLLTDMNMATAAARFYHFFNKYYSAVKTIEDYLRVQEVKSLNLMSHYLRMLIDLGEFSDINKIYAIIHNIPDKNIEAYSSMLYYLAFEQRFDEYDTIIEEAVNKFPTSVPLLLTYIERLLESNDVKKAADVLQLVQKLHAENSAAYLSRYYEMLGLFEAYYGNLEKASTLFTIALTFGRNNNLEMRLAALKVDGDQITKNLILKYKVQLMIRESRELLKNGQWDLAILKAIDAYDLNPINIDTNIFLAEVQMSRALFDSGIKTLKKLQESYPKNSFVVFKLMEAYIKTNQSKALEEMFTKYNNSEFTRTFYYPYILSMYYEFRSDHQTQIRYLNEAIRLNPVFDEGHYKYALILFKYKNFAKAKSVLTKAIELDPKNVDYRVLYAQLLYDLRGGEKYSSDEAIGYLKDLLNTFPNNQKIMSKIAIFYHDTGDTQLFELYQKKIESSAKKDKGFYEFLVKTGELNDNPDLILSSALKLIEINPGDMEAVILVAEIYLSSKLFDKSIEIINQAIARLSSYPRLHSLLSESYLSIGDFTMAEQMAKKEIEVNPTLADGHYALGEVHRIRQEYSLANKSYQLALKYRSDHIDALKRLAWIRKMEKNYNDARELYLRAQRVDPYDPENFRELGDIYDKTGRRALAIESYTEYLKLLKDAPDRAEIEQFIERLK